MPAWFLMLFFARGERSVWLIQGPFYYLEEPAMRHVLKEVSSLDAVFRPGAIG
jgi:hypothetical protein